MSNNIVIFGGDSHPELVAAICENLNISPSKVEMGKFANGETSIRVRSSVREKDVYVIQSGCGHVNDNLMQLMILISACKSASASKITAVLPYFCYTRQPDIPYTAKGAPLLSQNDDSLNKNKALDKAIRSTIQNETNTTPKLNKTLSSSRIPMILDGKKPTNVNNDAEELFNAQNAGYKLWVVQAGTLIANLLTSAGANHVITMDLHDRQFAGFFNIPVDNLYCQPIVQNYIMHNIPNYQDAVIVSPDAGGAKRATAVADSLKLSFAMIHKERRSQLLKGPPDATLTSGVSIPNKPLLTRSNLKQSVSNSSISSMGTKSSKFIQTTMLVGDVRNKVCILIDDLLDTSYTITRAAKLLKDQGATKVYAIVTHGIFSGDALERIAQSSIDKIIVTNTIPQTDTIKKLGKKRVDILDVSRVFAEAIRRIHNGESISMLFDQGW